jgi:hypothetical protein
MDTFLRGYFAKDITRMRRLLGLLPATFRTREFAWPWICSNFCLEYVSRELIEQAFVRRKSYFDTHADTHRGSIVEWLDIYPFSQRPEIGTWTTERRKIPQRLVAMDRRLLDFSFACPAELRANGSVFMRAALDLLGPGASIPNANNGVRPCSSNLGRIYERGLRKFEDLKENIIKACGWPVVIQHSWHDYNRYWLESVLLKGLVLSYRPHLSSIEGLIFNEKVSPIESSYLLNWRDGFRLLALAVWKSNLAMYRRELDASPVSPLSSITIPAPSAPPLEKNQDQSMPAPPGTSPQPQLQPPGPIDSSKN